MLARGRILISAFVLTVALPLAASAAPSFMERFGHPRPVPQQLLKKALERRGPVNTSLGVDARDAGSGTASTFSSCGSWAELSPGQTPFHQYNHVMVYDSARDRMLIFADSPSANGMIEVWALTLGASPTLTQIETQGGSGNWPYRAFGSAGVHDPVRDRVVLCGGYLYSGSSILTVAELSLSGTPTWTDVSPAGDPPQALVAESDRRPSADRWQ